MFKMDESVHDLENQAFFTSDLILKITVIIRRLAKYVIMQVHACRNLWGLVVTKESEPGVC